jgi:hypothetical protein
MNGWRQAPTGRSLKGRSLRRLLAPIVAGSLWLAVVMTAQATTAGQLDANYQGQTNASMSANNRTMLAQTFTALSTGQIDQVSLTIGNSWGGGRIYIVPAAADGTPTTSMPAASQGSYSGFLYCCYFGDYPISPKFSVVKGNKYAIVVAPSSGNLTWSDISPTSYTGGHLWVSLQSPASWSYQANYGGNFAFKTYVIGGSAVNQPPAVSANSPSVSVDEGAIPTTTGTYSDPDGDTVTLTPSTTSGAAGTVTPNRANGTWTWNGAPADEGPGQTITITANDGHGNVVKTQFSTVVSKVGLAVTIHGAPASGPEGTAIAFTASAISKSTDDNTAGFKYSWSATKDGAPFGSGGTGAAFTTTPDDEGAYVVGVQATDDGGATGSASVAFTGANLPPAAAITDVSPSLVMVPQELLTFTGSFSDPGLLDSHTVTWDFGDGASSPTATIQPGEPTTVSATHAYTKPGTYYADLTVTDDDGGKAYVGRTITIETPAQAIDSMASFVKSRTTLNGGQKNSLLAKLSAAADSWQRGNSGAACNVLSAFGHEVEAQSGAGLTSADASSLTAAAGVTQLSMGCFRPLLDFLSRL